MTYHSNMQKISVTIDVSKIDKSKIVANQWIDKSGVVHDEKNYTFDLVALKEPKHKTTTKSGWVVTKTHFASEAQTKEEREAKVESKYIGEGVQFEKEEDSRFNANGTAKPQIDEFVEELSADDIPF